MPEGSSVHSLPHMHWKYWEERSGWPGSRGYVLTEGSEIVAHAALVPLTFARNGRVHTLIQLLDWAARPGHAGAGVSLLKHMARLADGVLNVRASKLAQSIFRRLGYRSLGETTRYVLTEHAARALSVPATDVMLHPPGAFGNPASHPLETAESRGSSIVLRRSLGTFEALARCPAAPTTYGEVRRAGSLLGTFALAEAPGQLRLIDAWADTSQPGAWEDVLASVLARVPLDAQYSELVTQTNDPVQAPALLAAGFVPAGTDPLSVLADPSVVPDAAYVRHQLIDSDLAYLHHNVPDFWGLPARS